MALKPKYRGTRGDAKQLAKDVQPGDILYTVHNVADRYVLGNGGLEDPQYYSVHVVTADRSWPSGHPMVCPASSTSGKGTQSVVELLTREREVLTEQPAGMRDIARQRVALVDAKKLAARVARLHAQDVAADRAKKAAKQPVGAGAKRGWF